MKITIPDDYQQAVKNLVCFGMLGSHETTILGDISKEDGADKIFAATECLVLIRERTKVDRALIEKMPQLRLISQTGKVGRHIDVPLCTAAGIAVCEGSGSPIAPAELTWALIISARRRIFEAVAEMKKGNWQTNIGEVLHGQCLGVWGYGKIGRLVAAYGRAFGMKIQIWGSERAREAAKKDGFRACLSKEEFFETADVLTVHLRLVPETNGIISFADLQRMKSSALFVNTSRAELVEYGALEKALEKGHPGYAALDVFYEEPFYDQGNRLFTLPNLLCTPHIGYVEKNSYELYFRQAFENVLNFAEGAPTSLVNPEVLNLKHSS